MRVITQKELTRALFDHPYELALDYHGAMSVIHLSGDGSLLIGYWNAPVGETVIEYGENVEYIYIIEGKLEIEAQGERRKAQSGDVLQCGGAVQRVRFEIKEYVKAIFVVHPLSEKEVLHVREMQEAGRAPLFPIG